MLTLLVTFFSQVLSVILYQDFETFEFCHTYETGSEENNKR